MRVTMSQVRHRTWQGLVLLVAAMVLSSCGWRGISNVELPGGPGGGGGGYTRVRADAGHPGDQRQQQGHGCRCLRRLHPQYRAEELGGHPDAGRGQERQAAEERHRQDRADQLAGFAAHRAGRAGRPVAADAEERRHHPAEELVGLSQHRADAGQPGDGGARRRTPEPRSPAERGQQDPDRPGPADPRVPGQTGHLHPSAQRAARRHHPRHRLDQPAVGLRGHPVGCAGSCADRIPAADQVFRGSRSIRSI